MKQKLPEEILNIIFKINIKLYLLKKLIEKHPYKIRHIKTPSDFVQKLAVTQHGDAIQFIQNPSDFIQKLAVTQNGYTIQ
jgi:hypothetical protein